MNAWNFCEEFFKDALEKTSSVFGKPPDHMIAPIKSKWIGDLFAHRKELMRSLPIKSRWTPNGLVEILFEYMDTSGFMVQGRMKPGDLNTEGIKEFFALQIFNALLFLFVRGIPDGPYTDFLQDITTVEEIIGRLEPPSEEKGGTAAIPEETKEELTKGLGRSLIDSVALLKQISKPDTPPGSTGQYL